MGHKPFRLEIEYFGLKVSQEIDRLEDLLGMTLALGPYVKIGLRDLAANAPIHTTVALYQPSQGSKPPPFSKKIDGGDGSLLLVPVSTANVGWRRIIINGNAPVVNANASVPLNPPSVVGYDARRNVLLQGSLPSAPSTSTQSDQSSSTDSGIGSSDSSSSDGIRTATFPRQMAKRGRPFFKGSSNVDKRLRRE